MTQPTYVLELNGQQMYADSVVLGANPKVRIETGRLSSNNPYVPMTALESPLGRIGKLYTITPRGKALEDDLGSVVEAWNYTDFPSTAIVLIFDTKAVDGRVEAAFATKKQPTSPA